MLPTSPQSKACRAQRDRAKRTDIRVVDLTHPEEQSQASTFPYSFLSGLLIVADDPEEADAGALQLAQSFRLDPRDRVAGRALLLVDPIRPGQESCIEFSGSRLPPILAEEEEE